jgi:hypothetical protein
MLGSAVIWSLLVVSQCMQNDKDISGARILVRSELTGTAQLNKHERIHARPTKWTETLKVRPWIKKHFFLSECSNLELAHLNKRTLYYKWFEKCNNEERVEIG